MTGTLLPSLANGNRNAPPKDGITYVNWVME